MSAASIAYLLLAACMTGLVVSGLWICVTPGPDATAGAAVLVDDAGEDPGEPVAPAGPSPGRSPDADDDFECDWDDFDRARAAWEPDREPVAA